MESPRRRFFGSSVAHPRRAVLWVTLTVEEQAIIWKLAQRDGITMAQYVRECINDRLVEEGDDVPLLRIRRPQRRKAPGRGFRCG